MKIFTFRCDASNGYKATDLTTKPFTSYRKVANSLKPGEKVQVRVMEKSFVEGQLMLVGYGEVSLSPDGETFSYPRRLQHEY